MTTSRGAAPEKPSAALKPATLDSTRTFASKVASDVAVVRLFVAACVPNQAVTNRFCVEAYATTFPFQLATGHTLRTWETEASTRETSWDR